jgi:hypothetical protein
VVGAIAELIGKLLDSLKELPGLRRDLKRKKTLRRLLEDRDHKWRSIEILSRSIGASEEKTIELLVSIGARASTGARADMWGLSSRVDT